MLAAVIETAPAHAALLDYLISQQYGSIGFSVSQLGLFSVDGHFTRFAGKLAIDAQDPARSRIDVTIDARSAAMASAQAVNMLRSPAYFDVARYPAIHFVSRAITEIAGNRFTIRGLLTIRGVAHTQSLDASLVREKVTSDGTRIADFKVTGSLHRSAYGMTANENFVGDKVDLSIFIRLTLDAANDGG
jgi:polyisoprenoid-binding protein YceI